MYSIIRYILPALLAVATLLGASARAQSARWEPASGSLAREQITTLALVFSDAEPKTVPAPPSADGLEFLGQPGRSEQSSFNITLGAGGNVRRRTITYTYAVRPTRADGEARIPAFAIETDAGKLVVPAAGFTIAAATVGDSGLRLDQIAEARLEPPAATVWAGEVFMLRHVLGVSRERQFRASPELQWDQPPLLLESWSAEPARGVTTSAPLRNTETRSVRALVAAPGSHVLPAIRQQVVIATGQDIFGRPVGDQFVVATKPVAITARPLPSPAPADFSGAIGRFSLVSKIVPERAAVGEPVTWTLTLEGTGNWPLIDRLRPRAVPGEFRVVSPRAQKTPKDDLLFDAALAEDLVLIPQKPGRYTLGPYAFSIFNPMTGAYETLRAEPVVVEITAAAAPAADTRFSISAPAAGTDNGGETSASSVAAPAPAAPPAPVAPLPADPLPDLPSAAVPDAAWPRPLWLALSALIAPLALWLVLAARHARAHDPLRHRRAAHARLAALLPRLADRPAPADLLAWQHAARDRFALATATPSARDLPDPAWAALWRDTEAALYRPATGLPADWPARAREALLRAAPPRRPALAALRPAHLFARAAALALTAAITAHFLATPLSAAAPAPDDARRAYAEGDFPAAEKAFRAAVEAAPASPSARHNLALALAQRGRWDEAAAHALAGSLQAPGDPALARLVAATRPRAGFAFPPVPEAARRLPVARWQTLALAAALVGLGLAPVAYLFALHRPRARTAPLLAGHAALLGSLLVFTAAFLALRAHGPLAHPAAVIVFADAKLRAVPTEAGEQKIAADLPAGTIARVDKTFLGWRRLVLPDGNTGWTRADSLVGIWSAP